MLLAVLKDGVDASLQILFGQAQFPDRKNLHLIAIFYRYLRADLELSDGFDLITKKLDADGMRLMRLKNCLMDTKIN